MFVIRWIKILSLCLVCGASYWKLTFRVESTSEVPKVSLEKGGSFFLAYKKSLIQVSQDLVRQQKANLPSNAISISVSPEGKWLYVCLEDLSCIVYETNELSIQPISTGIYMAGNRNISMIAIFNRTYIASVVGENLSSKTLSMNIDAYFQDGKSNCRRIYHIQAPFFNRRFLLGFEHGKFVYFIALDSFEDIKVIRICNLDSCSLSSYYEQSLSMDTCGFANEKLDKTSEVCGASLFSQQFLGLSEDSVVISRCYDGLMYLCAYSLSSINEKMDYTYDSCATGVINETHVAWANTSVQCTASDAFSKCNFSAPLGDLIDKKLYLNPQYVSVVKFQDKVFQSLVLVLDGVHLIVIAYVSNSMEYFVGLAELNEVVEKQYVFGKKKCSSPVKLFKWHSGLDFVLAISSTEIVKLLLDDCSSRTTYSACIVYTNPLCGWCEEVKKCSRISSCSQGYHKSRKTSYQMRWNTQVSISPMFGPPSGGTVVTISGTNLSSYFEDYNSHSSITFNSIPCTPVPANFEASRRVLCRTQSMPLGEYEVMIRHSGYGEVSRSSTMYEVVLPKIFDIYPKFGPVSGGTKITLVGLYLHIGNTARVIISGNYNQLCNVISRNETVIICESRPAPNMTSTFSVLVQFDDEIIHSLFNFSYLPDPEMHSVDPEFVILAGGTVLQVSGANLDVPLTTELILNGKHNPCKVVSNSSILCIAHSMPRNISKVVTYELRQDGIRSSLQIEVVDNPQIYEAIRNADNETLEIHGIYLNNSNASEYQIYAAGHRCSIFEVSSNIIWCTLPEGVVNKDKLYVKVYVGQNLEYSMVADTISSTNVKNYILTATLVSFFVVLVCFLVLVSAFISRLLRRRRKKQKGEFMNMLMQLQLFIQFFKNLLEKVINSVNKWRWMNLFPDNMILKEEDFTTTNELLGKGQFGVITKGYLCHKIKYGNEIQTPVAIENLKGTFSNSDMDSMASAIARMYDFQHNNVLEIWGVCFKLDGGPVILHKFMKHGTLHKHLVSLRNHLYLDASAPSQVVKSLQ